MRSLAVRTLSLRGFRNLVHVDVELGDHLNVVAGENGQGKTNLLEAMYVVATSRSFRTSRLADLLGTGEEATSLRASVSEADEERAQSVGLRRGVRAVRVDGKRPETLAAYAVRTPTVVFHPGALALSTGGGAERRKLLDRVALYLEPASLATAESYARALRARQRVLDVRGDSAPDLDAWEALTVQHGLALVAARTLAANRLIPAAARAFERIGPPGASLGVRYDPGAPLDAAAFSAKLAKDRARDRARRSASVGPHRDDLAMELAGKPVRGIASQGQHRAVVLALQLAEIDVIAEARDVAPILLLDDVSSELDRARTSALLRAIHEERGQVLLTTTRPELIERHGDSRGDARRDFLVVEGRIAPT
jgi:DNA replication and repair protein RecF